jgi:hypothetical protein
MKKTLFIIILLLAAVFVLNSQAALAFNFTNIKGFYESTGGKAGFDIGGSNQYAILIGGLITAIFAVAGAIFVIMFIWGGFIWLTSAGSEDKIGKAKKTLTYAVIGIFIVGGAYTITSLISTTIESAGPSAPTEAAGAPGAAAGPTTTCAAPGACKSNGLCKASEGYKPTATTDCRPEICCTKVTDPEKCNQCGQGLAAQCTKVLCEEPSAHLGNTLGKCIYHGWSLIQCQYVPN